VKQQCYFQSGKACPEYIKNKHRSSPMAEILISAYLVWLMISSMSIYIILQGNTLPQFCHEKIPIIFQSNSAQQLTIKKILQIIQDGLHVRMQDYTLSLFS